LFQKANIEQKRSLLQIVLSNFSLDGDQLRWNLKEPFETMVLYSENSSWLTFAETFRTIYMDISPLRFKEIRELVDDYEAGRLDLTETKER